MGELRFQLLKAPKGEKIKNLKVYNSTTLFDCTVSKEEDVYILIGEPGTTEPAHSINLSDLYKLVYGGWNYV